jgi:hypothetical protein
MSRFAARQISISAIIVSPSRAPQRPPSVDINIGEGFSQPILCALSRDIGLCRRFRAGEPVNDPKDARYPRDETHDPPPCAP